ncbi:KTSC domain-containing protein [Herbaspirillum sp.]|uniref:KTSC domain-containing protein n=1 Tax=Herbaspirillum sp. TaxID=1890675 RepID=UPI000C0A5ABD|nr:KTSC domain-containing protein [Herbaspirillum sp.]MAF04378.1 KTSC domain-containing protein [Herbaspirillum sp.]|tara:strand:+ start:571 stop:837 length:267 start_codon:yes stop_codon:yes gene_type:complete
MTTEAIQHPTIAMDAVESSQIAAIGHDAATNTLAIQFPGKGDKPGSVYHYANFTADDFKAFQDADSKGSFFGKHIKKNTEKYPYTRIS